MKISNFFIWCAGSDSSILDKCSKAERIKHIGFGTLVIVPAILAFVSMSFALSTMEEIKDNSFILYLGGAIWASIIFSFDRFIVSTHRRKENNKKELQNPSFYLRFLFAFILGIVISHPLVMFYFNGSITDQLKANDTAAKLQIETDFDKKINATEKKIIYWDSLLLNKQKERNEQAGIVANEIDGEVLQGLSGTQLTTGLKGKGPSAKQKIAHLETLNMELEKMEKEAKNRNTQLSLEMNQLENSKSEAISAYSSSSDYLKRELALEQLKEGNDIVWITQWFLIFLFILVDVLPVVFKTFAPFGMYDKILTDDESIIPSLDSSSRQTFNQSLYDTLSANQAS